MAFPLIPTRYKSKLASVLSWPVGAEELSSALIDVPQFSELELSFYFRGANDIRKAQNASWMALLEVRYLRREGRISDNPFTVANGVLARKWTIRVNPVLREKRKHMHDGILLQLPRVASWLSMRNSFQSIGNSVIQVIWRSQDDLVYVSSSEDVLEPDRA